ncbi:unnamed protein product [Cylindrotheca closterium]|uniref:Uncharacterized protein n=1 Tax=Cylindrotheca closterium TaxID=2856 RepID=A0AAD2G302_9STRA|nr:unnamed protein product [Cylindrotheca closterium]
MCPHSAVLSRPNNMDDHNATYDKHSMAVMSRTSDESQHFYFLNADARKNLLKYEYKGADNSLLYQYILSPFALFCVEEYVPESIAPNSITLFGLMWMITSYVACWWFVPNLQTTEDVPSWIFLWNAIALLAYQTLDNMDGKQARKTGSSSPLGLLFDHGCDAINSIFGSANWIIAMGLSLEQDCFAAAVLIFVPFVLFYVATWEEYHVGELVLPIFNGPSEGLIMGAALHLTTFFKGTAFWHSSGFYNSIKAFLPFAIPFDQPLRNMDFIVIFTLMGGLQEIMLKTTQVNKNHPGSLSGLVPFAIFAASFILMGIKDLNVWTSIPRTGLHLAMVLFVEMTTALMLAHMTNQKFEYLRWQQLPLVVLTIAMLAFDIDADFIKYWISAYAWSIGSYVVMKSILVVQECCAVLNIWCFDIVSDRSPTVSDSVKAN